jgi:RNA polymerase sigma-70 factor (ECF subfamily)
LVRRLVAWRDDADDLVQDILVTLLERRLQFRGDSTLRTWVTRIAVNACRAHQRQTWLRRKLWQSWAERGASICNSGAAAEAGAIAHEQSATLRMAIARLPSNYREAIVLHYLENMTVAEAAESLGLRRGAFEVRLSRARGQLRELLSDKSHGF